MRKKKIKIIIQ